MQLTHLAHLIIEDLDIYDRFIIGDRIKCLLCLTKQWAIWIKELLDAGSNLVIVPHVCGGCVHLKVGGANFYLLTT